MCREALHFQEDFIDVHEHTALNWPAYLAGHPQASLIFESPVVSFTAKAFPEEDPSHHTVGLRVDFLVVR